MSICLLSERRYLSLQSLALLSLFVFLFQSCKKEDEKIFLFNGKDFSGWDTYLGVPQSILDVPYLTKDEAGNYTEAFGLNNDPMNIFKVVVEDGTPAIRISGYVWGALITKSEYSNYHLHFEYKWGDEKHPPREDLPRNSGLCYHSVGEYGVFWTYWMRSFEIEIKEGELGDFVRVDDVFADIEAIKDQELPVSPYRYCKGEPQITVNYANYKVWSRGDYEKSVGEWNSIDLFVFENNSVHVINSELATKTEGLRQNIEGKEEPLTKGKIQFQSEGAEIYYRNISINNITSLPY
jgi:hypothetical protein